jgi:hypothetical protein
MGKGRFLYDDYDALDNLDQFAASGVRDGQVGLAVKQGTGSATGLAGGIYIGGVDRQYRVQIDSIGGGAEVGQATFKWRDGTVIGWNASGVLTSTSPVALNNGVTFKWSSGSGADFIVGDRWDFTVAQFYGYRQLVDRDRDTIFQSKTLASPEWIRRDLGSAKQVTACVIHDHNLTSGATIILKANSADVWGAPPYSLAIPWAVDKIVAYLNQTYRYWRLEITDAGNPGSHIAIKWFLGLYAEPEDNFNRDWGQDRVATETVVRTDAGARRHLVQSAQEEFRLAYRNLAQTDLDLLRAVEAAAHDVTNLRGCPLWFHRDSDLASEIYLVTMPAKVQIRSPFLAHFDVDLSLMGLARTVR